MPPKRATRKTTAKKAASPEPEAPVVEETPQEEVSVEEPKAENTTQTPESAKATENPKKRKASSMMILTSADLPPSPPQKKPKLSSDLEDKLSKPLGSLIEESSEKRKAERKSQRGKGRRGRGGRGAANRGGNAARSVSRIPSASERVYKSDSYRIPKP